MKGSCKKMKKNKGILMALVTLCLTLVVTVGVAVGKSTKAEASMFDYFKRIKLKDCVVTLEYDSVDWNGKAHKPKVTVTYQNNELVENVDYMVEYYRNVSAGRAEVKVRGIAGFRGKRYLNFFINGIDIDNECTYKLNGSSVYVYHKGELVDPINYTVSEYEIRTKRYEDDFSTYKLVAYNVKRRYTVTGKGKYYGSFSYTIDEGLDFVREPLDE